MPNSDGRRTTLPRIKLVRQPIPSDYCGEACAAMILGITLDESRALFKLDGSYPGTKWKDIVVVLRARGVSCSDDQVPITGNLPKLCIVNVQWHHDRPSGHWVVKDGDRLLDPYYGEKPWSSMPLATQSGLSPETKRATHYGEIYSR